MYTMSPAVKGGLLILLWQVNGYESKTKPSEGSRSGRLEVALAKAAATSSYEHVLGTQMPNLVTPKDK